MQKTKKFSSPGRNFDQAARIRKILLPFSSWSNMKGRHLGELELFVTSGSKCVKLWSAGEILHHDMVIELSNCDHEEADTRLMLHAAHAANCGHETIVIKSPDTDVFVLGLYSKIFLPETSMFFYTGSVFLYCLSLVLLYPDFMHLLVGVCLLNPRVDTNILHLQYINILHLYLFHFRLRLYQFLFRKGERKGP